MRFQPLLPPLFSRCEICERLSAAETTALLTRLLLFPGAPRALLKLLHFAESLISKIFFTFFIKLGTFAPWLLLLLISFFSNFLFFWRAGLNLSGITGRSGVCVFLSEPPSSAAATEASQRVCFAMRNPLHPPVPPAPIRTNELSPLSSRSDAEDWFCECAPLYTGRLCQFSACERDPCSHGATCIPKSPLEAVCLCPYGRQGLLCDERECPGRGRFFFLSFSFQRPR